MWLKIALFLKLEHFNIEPTKILLEYATLTYILKCAHYDIDLEENLTTINYQMVLFSSYNFQIHTIKTQY